MIQRLWCKAAVSNIRNEMTHVSELLDLQTADDESLIKAWFLLMRCQHVLVQVIDSQMDDYKEAA